MTASALDAGVRRDLRGLQKETAEVVARHLVAAGLLVDDDPERALEHARYARRRASRIGVVREAAGIVAYHAGEWNEALGDFRAARRMGGGPGHVPVMADIERALGRPERALDLTRGPEVRDLDTAERIELLIVAAGARRDLGEVDASVVGLQVPELDPARREPWSARLFYAYADNLLAAGRESDAVQWFVHAHDADAERETDAAARLAELTGEELDDPDPEAGFTVDVEDLLPGDPDRPEHADAPDAEVSGPEASDVTAPTAEPAEVDARTTGLPDLPASATGSSDVDASPAGSSAGEAPATGTPDFETPTTEAPEPDGPVSVQEQAAPEETVREQAVPEVATREAAGEGAGEPVEQDLDADGRAARKPEQPGPADRGE